MNPRKRKTTYWVEKRKEKGNREEIKLGKKCGTSQSTSAGADKIRETGEREQTETITRSSRNSLKPI